jgi:hypothetical protein
MTAVQLLFVASFAGALLFFAAGAATMAVRRRRAEPDAQPMPEAVAHERARAVEPELAQARAIQPAVPQVSPFEPDEVTLERREEVTHELARPIQAPPSIQPPIRPDIAHERELDALRARADAAEAALAPLRGELERLRRDAAVTAAAQDSRTAAETRARQLAGELERTRNDSIAAGRDLEQLQARLREAERQLAERTSTVRDLAAENEQLKGRVNDAEGLRTEYVRLRTTAIDAAFLKSEVARLEEEVRLMRRDALGAPQRRPARGSQRLPTKPPGSIGESLSSVIERFADSGTRSIAIADTAGFALASSGEDGAALAAYAALLTESANRAKQLLPVAAPMAIELVDEHGARVSVWTFEVESERLLLVNLSVTPVDSGRVEATLADLTAILATPTSDRSYRQR